MFWKVLAVLILNFAWHCNGFVNDERSNNDLFELPIIHMNDFHARFVQTSSSSGICKPGTEETCVGGIARISTAARKIIEKKPNAIFLNAGDNYQGTLLYNVHRWKVVAEFMNKLPLDVTMIGNHDFDDHVAGLVPFLQLSKAPVVVANIDVSEEPSMKDLYQKSIVITRNNKKIGIIGVIYKDTPKVAKSGKVKFSDEMDTVNREAAKLKAEGVEIIIVLSHAITPTDKMMAENCEDIDVIIGTGLRRLIADSQDPTPHKGNAPAGEAPQDDYPRVIKQQSTNRTVLIAYTGAYSKYLGNLTVWFDEKGEVADWEGKPILLDSSVPQDEQMLNDLKPWVESVERHGNAIVGETKSFLEYYSCRLGECNMANLITDSMIEAVRDKVDNPNHWTYAAISFTNTGSIRNDIAAGPITFTDVISVMPFKDNWVVVEMTGDDLLHFLEKSASTDNTILTHWSGIKIVYNTTKPAYSRVQSLRIRCQACKKPEYELFERKKIYRVVALEYSVGLNNDNNFSPLSIKRFNISDTEYFIKYIKSISPFTYELDQRMTFVH